MENSPETELPLSPQEKAKYQAEAAAGKTPPLNIVRRFIITIRKAYLASPKAIEKSKVTRNAKPAAKDETQIDFF